MDFDEVKTDTLNLRVAPSFKSTLKALADAEHRSMVNMLEVILVEYFGRKGLAAPIRKTSHPQNQRQTKRNASSKTPA